MKKIWYISLLLLLYAIGVDGQEAGKSLVAIRNLEVARGENTLFVSMDVDVSALSIATNQEILLVPVLKGERDSMQLTLMIVAGRNRYYYHLRNTPVSGEEILERAGQTDIIHYRTTIPYFIPVFIICVLK